MKVMQTAGLPENLVRDAEEELESPQEGLTYLEPTHDDTDAFERLYYSPVELQHNAKKARAKASKWKKVMFFSVGIALLLAVLLGFAIRIIGTLSGTVYVSDAVDPAAEAIVLHPVDETKEDIIYFPAIDTTKTVSGIIKTINNQQEGQP